MIRRLVCALVTGHRWTWSSRATHVARVQLRYGVAGVEVLWCSACDTVRPSHVVEADRGGSGIGVVLFAVAIAVLSILFYLSVAQEFERSACDRVAGTPAACQEAP